MSNSSITKKLIAAAHKQRHLLEHALADCFDTCLDGLYKTYHSVKELHEKDSYFFMRASRTYVLKNEITNIQEEYDSRLERAVEVFHERKIHCKEILLSMINELEAIVSTSEIRKYLDELSVMISNIISNDPVFALCRTDNFFQWIIQILLVSKPDILNQYHHQDTFQDKLHQLMKNIERERLEVLRRKENNVSILAQYFETFIVKLNALLKKNVSSTTKIVWYDASIGNEENQSYVKQIQKKFSTNEVVQCVNENHLVQLIRCESFDEIILITSGKTGKSIIDKIGYYWNLKGIIIYCSNINYHQTWAKPYKKVTLVTNKFCDVLIDIENILDGKSYFIIKGFTYDDICLNLRTTHNANYYLSPKVDDGFIISNFYEVILNINFQKEIMQQLHNKIQTKGFFNNQLPAHFQLPNLESVAEHFIKAFDTEPSKSIEDKIINLYSKSKPCLYKVVNDVLNLLDEELILLIGDYIKTLRYSLIKYVDNEPKMKYARILKLYRGIYLDQQSTENFLKKFKVNDYIIFPSFLSTTMDKATALQFSQQKGVLFEIIIDTTSDIPNNMPKCIKAVSEFKNEEEIVFNCFSMLKVNTITTQNENFYLYQCSLENLG
ncbi:unnamed protein product [Rotaria magnacalcarata]|uniref:Uncharacterized protein n=1 Tax=Rotaria magnacalcarata TaxID=392030 RepID=A0A816UGS6_9BILA|nr:unnamed protein product [Rotaria magnacalcarata]CAF4003658.1 unnamed protein product [Rotaria magnacalcarata]